jgi:hypothetical protein
MDIEAFALAAAGPGSAGAFALRRSQEGSSFIELS